MRKIETSSAAWNDELCRPHDTDAPWALMNLVCAHQQTSFSNLQTSNLSALSMPNTVTNRCTIPEQHHTNVKNSFQPLQRTSGYANRGETVLPLLPNSCSKTHWLIAIVLIGWKTGYDYMEQKINNASAERLADAQTAHLDITFLASARTADPLDRKKLYNYWSIQL